MKRHILRTFLTILCASSLAHASAQDDLAQGQAAVINALVAGAEAHAPQLLASARANLQKARESTARLELERARQLARQAFAEAAQAQSRSLAVREARHAPQGTR